MSQAKDYQTNLIRAYRYIIFCFRSFFKRKNILRKIYSERSKLCMTKKCTGEEGEIYLETIYLKKLF